MNNSSRITREDCQSWVISYPDLCGEVRRKAGIDVKGVFDEFVGHGLFEVIACRAELRQAVDDVAGPGRHN